MPAHAYGGGAPNIVAEPAEAKYFVRSNDASELEALTERVRACRETGTMGEGASVKRAWWEYPYRDLRGNLALAKAYRANEESLGCSFIEMADIPVRATGSADTPNVSDEAPSIDPTVTIAPPNVTLHADCFAQCAASESEDRGTLDGAKAVAMTSIVALFSRRDLRAAVAEDFERIKSRA